MLRVKKYAKVLDIIYKNIYNFIMEYRKYEGKIMKDLVEILINKGITIATMESCTGGGVANSITNVEGASEILKFSAVTYSNEYKIKMGVNPKVIDKYSVYSHETANEMSKNISKFAESNLGVGITGKLNRVDVNNPYGEDNVVFISIYDSRVDKYYNSKVEAVLGTRQENKELVIKKIVEMILELVK